MIHMMKLSKPVTPKFACINHLKESHAKLLLRKPIPKMTTT
jgi:hypothetical protein